MTDWLITTIHLLSGKLWQIPVCMEFSLNWLVDKENGGKETKIKQCALKRKN